MGGGGGGGGCYNRMYFCIQLYRPNTREVRVIRGLRGVGVKREFNGIVMAY